MIINWKKPNAGVLIIPIGSEGNDTIVVKYLQLLPGNNLVKDEDWPLAKKHVLDKIDMGWIEEIEEGGKKSSSLKDLSAKKAKEVIRNTYELNTLKKWQEEEGRDELRAVIHNQIEEVNSPKVKVQGDK